MKELTIKCPNPVCHKPPYTITEDKIYSGTYAVPRGEIKCDVCGCAYNQCESHIDSYNLTNDLSIISNGLALALKKSKG